MAKQETISESNKLREDLANLCHEQWSGWMDYLFGKCEMKDGDLIIPGWGRERWQRQVNTKYENLTEMEKESDRKEADKFLRILNQEKQKSFEEAISQVKQILNDSTVDTPDGFVVYLEEIRNKFKKFNI